MVVKVLLLIIAGIVLLGVVVYTGFVLYDVIAENNAARKVRKLNQKLDELEERNNF